MTAEDARMFNPKRPAGGRSAFAALACACGVIVGCAARANHDAEPSATTSLVYSPAAKLPADRDTQPPRAAVGEGLRTGVRCRVHLRRDAAGLAGAAPVSIVGTSMISERSSVVGTIDRIDPDAITLRGDSSTYWIPRDMILAVEFPEERRQ